MKPAQPLEAASARPRTGLMVIDHQPAFAHPDSPWFCPALAQATPQIAKLVTRFGDRVLFTRFVPPAEPTGSWRGYYQRWPFALQPGAEWLWPVSPPWADRPSIASHTFSKWTDAARSFFGPETEVTICGVATDCCVLARHLPRQMMACRCSWLQTPVPPNHLPCTRRRWASRGCVHHSCRS